MRFSVTILKVGGAVVNASLVPVEIRLLREGFVASPAFEWAISRVRTAMTAQIRFLIKGLRTLNASERFHPRVDFYMAVQIRFLCKYFKTMLAFVDISSGKERA